MRATIRFGRWIRVVGLCSCSLFVGCAEDAQELSAGAEAGRPNLLLITIESIRSDHVGGYGYFRPTTPALDALGAQGTTFEQSYAVTSWTLPAHASLFTGLYPAAHRVVDYRSRLDDSYDTLAELLGGVGYQTAGLISGPFLQRQYNLNQGFEIYEQSASNPAGNQAAHGDVTNPEMWRQLERFLVEQRDPDRPFFLFAYLWDPHYDYIPPEPFDTAFRTSGDRPVDLHGYEVTRAVHPGLSQAELDYVISQYDGELGSTDQLLGRLWSRLQELGLWDDTVVVVLADHGEEFFEHGQKGHRHNLYEPSVRVPLVLRVPGQVPGRESRPVSQIDVLPTLLQLAGAQPPGTIHGRSLLDLPGPGPESRPLFLELKSEWLMRDPATGERGVIDDLWFAVRQGPHKLIIERNDRRNELFDVLADPLERTSLTVRLPDVHRRLDELLTGHINRMKIDAERFSRSVPVELTPDQEERLRALGYVSR